MARQSCSRIGVAFFWSTLQQHQLDMPGAFQQLFFEAQKNIMGMEIQAPRSASKRAKAQQYGRKFNE
ncbi:MAG: hypothetical protein AAF732_10910 [Pseudomonadota bacterium]